MKPRKAVGPLEGRGFTVETTDSPQDFCSVHPFLSLTQDPPLNTYPPLFSDPASQACPYLILLLGTHDFGHSPSLPRPRIQTPSPSSLRPRIQTPSPSFLRFRRPGPQPLLPQTQGFRPSAPPPPDPGV